MTMPVGPRQQAQNQRNAAQAAQPTTPTTTVVSDEELASAQRALKAAQQNLDNARYRYDNAATQRDFQVSQGDADPLVIDSFNASFGEAQNALAKAEESWALANRQLAVTYANIAGRAQTPEQAAELRAQAQHHSAQANLANAEADALKAKTPAETAAAQAAMTRAQNEALRVQSEIEILIPAQAAELAQGVSESKARVSQLFPAQAEAAVAGADASRAQAEATRATIDPNIRNILAQAGYTEKQIQAVDQALKRPTQITSAVEGPTLAFQDPESGLVSGQTDPRYKAANTQLLQNQYDTLSTIQGMIERNEMSPQEGQTYMDSIRAQSQAAIAGTTPFQQTQERNRFKETGAGIGRDILNNRMQNASSLASSLTSGMMTGARGMTRPFDFSGIDPFAMAGGFATQQSGGQGIIDLAMQLIQGVGDRGMGQDGLPNQPPGTNVVSVPYGQGGGSAQPQQQQQPMPVTIPDTRYQRRF